MGKPENAKRRTLLFGLTGIFTLVTDREVIASDNQEDAIKQPNGSDDASFIARAFDMQRQAIATVKGTGATQWTNSLVQYP